MCPAQLQRCWFVNIVNGCALVQPVARGPDLSGAIPLPSPRPGEFNDVKGAGHFWNAATHGDVVRRCTTPPRPPDWICTQCLHRSSFFSNRFFRLQVEDRFGGRSEEQSRRCARPERRVQSIRARARAIGAKPPPHGSPDRQTDPAANTSRGRPSDT